MTDNNGKKQGWRPLIIILAVNCLVWSAALVASAIMFSKTGQAGKMYPIHASGSVVSIVALSMALRNKRRSDKGE